MNITQESNAMERLLQMAEQRDKTKEVAPKAEEEIKPQVCDMDDLENCLSCGS